MIKAVHIEDEFRNVKLLQGLVLGYCSNLVKLEGHAGNIDDAVKLIKEVRPSLIYLDIELNRGNAFELLERLTNENITDFHVIFITAFNEYAIRAFRHNAIDYLLKPINIEELKEATVRVSEKISRMENNDMLLNVLKQIRTDTAPQKIGFPVTDGMEFVHTDKVMRCEARGSYTAIHLSDGKVILALRNMKQLEDILPRTNFFRVHNSWIINTNYLRKYFRGANSYILMDDGTTIPVSIRRKGGFLDFFSLEE